MDKKQHFKFSDAGNFTDYPFLLYLQWEPLDHKTNIFTLQGEVRWGLSVTKQGDYVHFHKRQRLILYTPTACKLQECLLREKKKKSSPIQ